MAEGLQKRLQTEVEKYKTVQKGELKISYFKAGKGAPHFCQFQGRLMSSFGAETSMNLYYRSPFPEKNVLQLEVDSHTVTDGWLFQFGSCLGLGCVCGQFSGVGAILLNPM